MPVRGLGWHWLWGNGMNFAISLAAVRSIDARHSLRDFCGKYVWNKTRGVNERKQISRGDLSSLFE